MTWLSGLWDLEAVVSDTTFSVVGMKELIHKSWDINRQNDFKWWLQLAFRGPDPPTPLRRRDKLWV